MRSLLLGLILVGCGAETRPEPSHSKPEASAPASANVETSSPRAAIPAAHASGTVVVPNAAPPTEDRYVIAGPYLDGAGTYVLGVAGSTVFAEQARDHQRVLFGVPVTGGVPTLIHRSDDDEGTPLESLDAHLVFQPHRSEPVHVVRAGTLVPIALPGSRVACSALASTTSRVFCLSDTKLLAWSLEGERATGPEIAATGLDDVKYGGLVPHGDRLFVNRTVPRSPIQTSRVSFLVPAGGAPAQLTDVFDTTGSLRRMGRTRGLGVSPWHGCLTPWALDGKTRSSLEGACDAAMRFDEDDIYVTHFYASGADPDGGDLWAVHPDGTATQVALDPAPADIAGIGLDATHVFWGSADGRIRRAPR